MDFSCWVRQFEDAARERGVAAEPDWDHAAAALPDGLVRSLQRFQTGENGDGASLIGKAVRAGDPQYLAAARMFVAEEQNHARLLALVLARAGRPTIAGHWSDTVFVAVRRALGLRLELMTLMLAEVVALRYYRALRDGVTDPVLSDVAGRILVDEQRHVPFHVDRLRQGLADLPAPARAVLAAGWWTLCAGAIGVVAVGHAAGLRALGVAPARFAMDVAGLFHGVVREVLGAGRHGSPSSAAGTGSPVSPAR